MSIYDDIAKLNYNDMATLQQLLTPKLNEFIPHMPTPKQKAFMLLMIREAFYGGAAGGGKSDALLMDALQNVDVKGYAAIIFRKTFADLNKPGALIPRAHEWLAPGMDLGKVKWNEKKTRFEFLETFGRRKDIKSILQFGYLDTAKSRFNYQGGEYQYIGYDELTHIYEVCYKYMFSRLRRLKGSTIPLKVRSASNPPEDDSGIWVYERFVKIETKQPDAIFIPAGLDDNPYLDREEYLQSLEMLDPVSRARLRDGDWEIRATGNMFKEEWFPIINGNLNDYRQKVRFWDLAATKKKKSDETVGYLMSQIDGRFIIEDIEILKGSPNEVNERVRNIAKMDGYATYIREEIEPGSSGLFTEEAHKSLLKGFMFEGIRSLNNKVERAKPFSAACEKGKVGVWHKCRNIERFFAQAKSFPNVNHDDIVDAGAGAFNFLNGNIFTGMPVNVFDENNEDSYWHRI